MPELSSSSNWGSMDSRFLWTTSAIVEQEGRRKKDSERVQNLTVSVIMPRGFLHFDPAPPLIQWSMATVLYFV